MANLWIKKSISSLQVEAAEEQGGLKRTLGARSLVALGIGAIIGAGLFSITGSAAGNNAGPAVTISFIIAAVACVAMNVMGGVITSSPGSMPIAAYAQ